MVVNFCVLSALLTIYIQHLEDEFLQDGQVKPSISLRYKDDICTFYLASYPKRTRYSFLTDLDQLRTRSRFFAEANNQSCNFLGLNTCIYN